MTSPTFTGLNLSITVNEDAVNATPRIIDADVSVTDPNDHYAGGTLVVSGLLAEDTIAIRNQGTAGGQIGHSGGNVTFGGTVIGAASGGAGATLTVTFNANATSAAVEALIENLTYANSSDAPTASRMLKAILTDGDGNPAIAPLFFAMRTGAGNPFNGFEIGVASKPTFGDLDADGDLDLVVGQSNGEFHYFKNTGTATAPNFVEQSGTANPLNGFDVHGVSAPALADVDGDGDLDLVAGPIQVAPAGVILNYFENTGTSVAPVFVERTGPANPFVQFADDHAHDFLAYDELQVPALGDVDNDQDLDVVVGGQFGNFHWFENESGFFHARLTGDDPFYDINNLGVLAAPALGDLDGDGDLDIVAGFGNGETWYIENIGSPGAPAFGTPIQIGGDVGFCSAPALADLDGDGDLDLAIGETDGTLNYFLNTQFDIVIDVTAENDAPIALNDRQITGWAPDGGTIVTATVQTAIDPDGTIDHYELVSGPAAGTLIFNTQGTYTFLTMAGGMTPGEDATFTYRAVDNSGAVSDPATVTITVTGSDTAGVNDPIQLTRLDGWVTFDENTVNATPRIIDGNVSVFDPDGGYAGGSLTVSGHLGGDTIGIRNEGTGAGQIGVAGGVVTYGGVVIGSTTGGSGGTTRTVTFNANATSPAVEALIENLTFANSSNNPSTSRTITVTLTDGAGQVAAGGPIEVVINVALEDETPVTAPALTFTGLDTSVTFDENTVNATPRFLDANVHVANPDSDYTGGTLQVAGLLAEDTVSIRNEGTAAGKIGFSGGTVTYGGTVIGTATGGAAGATLNVAFTGAATSEAVEALVENLTYANSSNTPTASRTLTIQFADAVGGGPLLEQVASSLTVKVTAENEVPVAQNGTGTTGEDNVLNASVPAAADSDGTIASHVLNTGVAKGVLDFNPNGSFSFDPNGQFEALAPGQQEQVSFTYHAVDQTGGVSGVKTVTITVTGANDAPDLSGLVTSRTFGENTVNAAPQIVDGDVTFSDVEANLNGGSLTVTGHYGGDHVAIKNQGTGAGQIGFSGGNVSFGGTVIGTATGGGAGSALVVTFNANATAAAVEALIENLTYANTNDVNPAASRTLAITVTDAAGGGDSTSVAINVFTENDAPVAQNASYSVGEGGTISTNLPQATDVDGTVTAYVLDAGPLKGSLSFNANGSIVYSTEDDFEALNNGQSEAVTFTYHAVDNSGALSAVKTVTITVNGADEPQGFGAPGATKRGTRNDDKLVGRDSGDNLHGGEGRDKLFGNEGDDRLTGGRSDDKLIGGLGEDSFVFNMKLKDNVDTVKDFDAGIDSFVLNDKVFKSLSPGPLSVEEFVVGKRAKDDADHIIYNAKNGQLLYDKDGKGGADAVLFAKAQKDLDLDAGDFLVI